VQTAQRVGVELVAVGLEMLDQGGTVGAPPVALA